MTKVTYINATSGIECIEYWNNKNGLKRFNFLKRHKDFINIKMKYISLGEYLKNHGWRG